MNKKELLELIKTGEGYTLEFKESFSNSIGKEMCAFANASGGRIILGVRDDNLIKGFSLNNRTRSDIQNTINNINPRINVTIEVVDNLVVLDIPEGSEKPYAINSEFYLRQGANSQKLTRDEILEFFRNSNKISFEKQINTKFDLEKDFNEEKFKVFVKKANITDSLSVEHILGNLNLMTDNKPNNACALLFPHRVTKFFLNGDISCVLYQGKSTAVMLDKKVFDADFLSNFENAVLFVQRNTKTKADIVNLVRVESPEIPENALREAIINAMIHKDYFIEGRILIEIFSDRIAIGNPGKLLFNQSELGGISILRNPIITDCILRTELIEKIGSGIGRMRELVPSVKFDISSNWFRVVFTRETTESQVNTKVPEQLKALLLDLKIEWSEKWSEKWSELTKREQAILLLILENPTINREQLSSRIGINASAIQKHITKLKIKAIIARKGGAKGGHWEIVK